jgi:hypothetical protein
MRCNGAWMWNCFGRRKRAPRKDGSLTDLPNVKDERSEQSESVRLPFRYSRWMRIFCAFFLMVFGLTVAANILFYLVLPWTFTDATYVSQMTVPSGTRSPELKVQVRFSIEDHEMVTAYIYPGSNHLNREGPLQIIYQDSDPQNAFYATPWDSAVIPIYFSISGALLIAGIGLFVSEARWRRRIFALASSDRTHQPVQLYEWKHLKMMVVSQEGGPKYQWQVFDRTLQLEGRPNPADASPTTREYWAELRTEILLLIKQARLTEVKWPTPRLAEISGDLGPGRWIIIHSADELIVPLTRAHPIIGTGYEARVRPIGNEALISAHRQLLAAYATVRDQADRLPRLAFVPILNKDGSKLERNRHLCSRLLVRLRTDYHVRRQLRRLSDIYLRDQMLLYEVNENVGRRRQILAELRGDCELVINSAARTTRRTVSTLAGIATLLSAIAVIAKLPQLPFTLVLKIILAAFLIIVLFSPGIIMLVAYNEAFRIMQQLFLSNSLLDVQIERQEGSIYAFEDTLFNLIGQPESVKRASGRLGNIVALAMLIVFLILLGLALLKGNH